MPAADAWDDADKSRRKAKRYQTRWKVALVFDSSSGKPIFHTLTHDLSVNGASVQCNTEEAVHKLLTLLLLAPTIGGAQRRIIRLKAIVMSCMPFRGGFRLGMSFIQDAELDKLRTVLATLDLSGDSLPSDPNDDALPKLL